MTKPSMKKKKTIRMEDNNTNTSIRDDASVTLTIRWIMHGKEIGSMIGEKVEIVTSISNIFQDWCSHFNGGKTEIPIRFIVPSSQCGALIGKRGSKINKMRKTTGCSIQVASEMIPNSTERAIKLRGTTEQITQCIYQICFVILESPSKGTKIPHKLKPQVAGPAILSNGKDNTLQGNYAALALAGGLHSDTTGPLLNGVNLTGSVPAATHLEQLTKVANNPANNGGHNTNQYQQHEMTVSNDLILRISNCEEREGGTNDRTITISGNPYSVSLAQYLINMRTSIEADGLPLPAPNSIVKTELKQFTKELKQKLVLKLIAIKK